MLFLFLSDSIKPKQKNGFVNKYNKEIEFQAFVRHLIGLSYVPFCNLKKKYDIIKQKLNENIMSDCHYKPFL
jgi:hypothetical protein